MRIVDTVKLNGVNQDIIKLQLFPFSLRDVVASFLSQCHMDKMTTGRSWLKLLWRDFSHQPSHKREEGR